MIQPRTRTRRRHACAAADLEERSCAACKRPFACSTARENKPVHQLVGKLLDAHICAASSSSVEIFGKMRLHPVGRDAPSVSKLIEDLPSRLPQRTTIADVIAALGDRAFGILLVAVSIPAVVPTPGLPAGLVFGTILAIFAAQATTGASRMILPTWLAHRQVSRRALYGFASRGSSFLRRVERLARPRLTGLTSPAAVCWLGPILFVLGLLIALPIPFGNTLPGLGALLIGIGIASRDGLVVSGGLTVGAVGALVSVALMSGGWRLASSMLGGE